MRRLIFTSIWIIGVTVAGTALYVGTLLGFIYARIHFGWPKSPFDGALSLAIPGIVAASVGVFAWGFKGRLPGTSHGPRSAEGRGFPVEPSGTTRKP